MRKWSLEGPHLHRPGLGPLTPERGCCSALSYTAPCGWKQGGCSGRAWRASGAGWICSLGVTSPYTNFLLSTDGYSHHPSPIPSAVVGSRWLLSWAGQLCCLSQQGQCFSTWLTFGLTGALKTIFMLTLMPHHQEF